MNLKESFRYQNFLDTTMNYARASITNPQHVLKFTKTHMRSKANPDAQDLVENVEVEKFYPNDDVIKFMLHLSEEKHKLTCSIGRAKAMLGFDLDAAIESNKYNQTIAKSINLMLAHKASKRTEMGSDYKFNVEGNQMVYRYEIEVQVDEAFDRAAAKATVKEMITACDKRSAEIDAALINTVVDYEPPYDVNDSFEDAMEVFMAAKTDSL